MKNIIKYTLIFLGSCLLMLCTTPKKEHFLKSKDFKIDSVPQLTYMQMIEDHDSLVSYIKQVSPIIYFNKEVRGIDFEKHAKHLKTQITAKT